MRTRATAVLIALAVAVLLTFLLSVAAYYSYAAGAETTSRVLLWPNSLLQALVPCNNIGSLQQPLCEGTPLNVLAYAASFPLSIAVYAAIAYLFIRNCSRNGT